MEIKAKDMCPRCKHCLGMTPQGMYSCGYSNDGSELNIGIDVVLNCANFEWKNGKVKGKVSDICPNCKNCKGITRESNGVHVWLTEIECEDPYDGMVKTLDSDSSICCSMFETRPNQFVMIGEKDKEIERLAKKNRELQIRVNDLIFQHQEDTKKIVELKNDKYSILKENMLLRINRYPTYSAMKAEDKIEHIQKEAKKWKNKYKEAYDILQEFFGEHSNIMSVNYDVSHDYLTLEISYDVREAGSKYQRLENAYERLKKL